MVDITKKNELYSVPQARSGIKAKAIIPYQIIKTNPESLKVSKFHGLPYSSEERIRWLKERLGEKQGIPHPIVCFNEGKFEVLTNWDVVSYHKSLSREVEVRLVEVDEMQQIALAVNWMIEENWHWTLVGDNLSRIKKSDPKLTVQQIATAIGMDRSGVSRLIKCAEELSTTLKNLAVRGAINFENARKLVTKTKEEQDSITSELSLGKISQKKLTERLGLMKQRGVVKANKVEEKKSQDLKSFEELISQKLGFPVAINMGEKGGEMCIRFFEIGDIETITDGLFGKGRSRRGFEDF